MQRRRTALWWDATRDMFVLGLRRLRAHMGLTALLLVGTFLAVGVAAAAPIYLQSIRDLGLTSLVRAADPETLNLEYRVTVPAVASNVEAIERQIDAEVDEAAGGIVETRSASQGSAGFTVEATTSPLAEREDPRAFFRWHTDFEELTTLEGGERAEWDGSGPLPAQISRAAATQFELVVGDRLTLQPFWLTVPLPTEVVVSGIFEPLAEDPRWIAPETLLAVEENVGVPLWLTRDVFLLLGERTPQMRGSLDFVFTTDASMIRGDDADRLGSALTTLDTRLAQRIPNLRQESELPELLAAFGDRFTFAESALLVLVLQLVAVLLLYLVITSAMVAEQRAEEVAWLRSRGASLKRVAGLQLVESLLITVVPVVLGPFIALGLVSLLGFVPPFDEINEGTFVPTRMAPLSWYLALVAGGLAIVAQFVPTIRASRRTIVNVRQSQSRHQTDWRARVVADSATLALAAILIFELRRDSSSAVSLGGEASLELLSVATPSILLFAAGLVVLRLFPIVLRVLTRSASAVMSPTPLLTLMYLGRSPTHYGRVLLLMLVVSAIAVFASSFKATLDRSYDERSLYVTGSDLRLDGFAGERVDPFSARRAIERAEFGPGATPPVIAPIERLDGRLAGDERAGTLKVLAADAAALEAVAFLRDDFGADLREKLGALPLPPQAGELTIPEPRGNLGLWVRFDEVGAGTSLFVRVRDEAGLYFEYAMGFVLEAEREDGEQFIPFDQPVPLQLVSGDGTFIADGDAIHEWVFLERSLVVPTYTISLIGRRFIAALPNPPRPRGELEVMSISLLRVGRRADVPGRALLDDLTWTQEDETRVLDDFSDPGGWEVIPPTALQAPRERAQLVEVGTISGPSALALDWESQSLNFDAGIRRRAGAALVPALVSTDLIERAGSAVGEPMVITSGNVEVEIEVVGAISHFPTFDPEGSEGLVILDLAAFMNQLMTSSSAGSRVPSEREVWVGAFGIPDARILKLVDVDPDTSGIHSARDERAAIEADPLIVAGWNGIFAASLVAVAVAASFGLTALTVLMARNRRVQFSVLRSLGFAPQQVVTIVVLETAAVVGIGLGLGLLVATQSGPILLDLFALTPDGRSVLPPLIFELDWSTLGLVFAGLFGLFAANAVAAVMFIWRLELQSALRQSA